jgi:hypothetical protein
MKKKFHIVLLTVFLTSCASLADFTNLIITPTPPPPPPVTATSGPSGTAAPTQNLFATATKTPLTFTPTVTQLGAELFTPTMTVTQIPTEAPPTYGVPPGFFNGIVVTPPVGFGFLAVTTSHSVLYWNEGPCTPRNVKVTAFVEDILATHRVLLFTRLRLKKNTLNETDWNSGAIMLKADNGSFTYDLGTDNLRRYYYYTDAFIEYQLVAVTDEQEVIGRTQIYDRSLSLVRCIPVR